MKSIKVGSASIPVEEYASQGNAVLGIRDSGKSYTAMVIAEQLMDHGVPIVAFDPIGVWRFLRVPGKGKGFPVVVAGGEHGDFNLTPESAPKIVEAAMKNNISLVLDLFSIDLSKADWKRIVENSVRLLLHNNRKFGLRHIFIEEAAEFAPQRVGPDQGRVYAEIEKLARMGGNSMLGYTLINQRSEEVNKAVLELCDCLMLHRQKGRNSLTALGKWLDFADTNQSKEIIKTLPTLEQGSCWVWSAGSGVPKLVEVQEKKSFHPDRRKMMTGVSEAKSVDVKKFVEDIKSLLEKDHPKNVVIKTPAVPVRSDSQVNLLKEENRNLKVKLAAAEKTIVCFQQKISQISKICGVDIQPRAGLIVEKPVDVLKRIVAVTSISTKKNSLPRAEQRILMALAQYPSGRTRTQAAILAGYACSGGGFNNAIGYLRSNGLIERDGETMMITRIGLEVLGKFEPLPTGRELFDHWQRQLPRAERKILEVLFSSYPNSLNKEEIGQATGYQSSGGGFNNAIGKLRTLELISGRNDIKASDSLF